MVNQNDRKRGARDRAYYLLLRLWYSVGSLHWSGHWPTLGFEYWCRVWWWCAAVDWPAFAVDCFAAFDFAVGPGLDATALVAVEMVFFLCVVNFVRHFVCFLLTKKILCVRIQLIVCQSVNAIFHIKWEKCILTVQLHRIVCVSLCFCLKFTDCCVCCCAVALAVVWFACWFCCCCCCCCGWPVWPAAAFVALCAVRFPNEFADNGIDMFVPGIVNVAWPNAVARLNDPPILVFFFSECFLCVWMRYYYFVLILDERMCRARPDPGRKRKK